MRQENQRPETGPTRDQRETKQDQRKSKERDPDALLRQTDRQTDRQTEAAGMGMQAGRHLNRAEDTAST